jgi:hypothetical protein
VHFLPVTSDLKADGLFVDEASFVIGKHLASGMCYVVSLKLMLFELY